MKVFVLLKLKEERRKGKEKEKSSFEPVQ